MLLTFVVFPNYVIAVVKYLYLKCIKLSMQFSGFILLYKRKLQNQSILPSSIFIPYIKLVQSSYNNVNFYHIIPSGRAMHIIIQYSRAV